MDEINAFFNRHTPIVRKQISGGTTNGRLKIETTKKPKRSDDFASTSHFAEQHIAENQQQLLDVSRFFIFSNTFFLHLLFVVVAITVVYPHINFNFRDSMT